MAIFLLYPRGVNVKLGNTEVGATQITQSYIASNRNYFSVDIIDASVIMTVTAPTGQKFLSSGINILGTSLTSIDSRDKKELKYIFLFDTSTPAEKQLITNCNSTYTTSGSANLRSWTGTESFIIGGFLYDPICTDQQLVQTTQKKNRQRLRGNKVKNKA